MTKKSLPPCVYKNLKKWIESFDNFKLYGDSYCKKIHKRISDGDNFLPDEDKFILKNLFSSQIINKDNLFEYFLNFEDYSPKNDIESSVIKNALEEFKFKEADKNFKSDEKLFNLISIYEKVKAEYLKKYFEKVFVEKGIIDNAPDLEQAEAIGSLGGNILVSARAGSGKTQTIAGKVAFLVNKYDINPEDILVLCFNKSASESMKKRIQKFVPNFENAKTFHGWSWSIVNPEKNSVLFDNNGEFSPKKNSDFIKKIIEDCEKQYPKFKEKIYNFFREEYEKLDENLSETKYFKSEQERYLYLRNQTQTTLSGINVKSRGEKWIADFLFEHDIQFYYEQQFTWKKLDEKPHYHPDFTVKYNNKKFILEHWGIDEFDLKKEVPEHWTKTWEGYKEEMEKKRNYFSKNQEYKDKFIETSIRDINYSLEITEQRKSFEKILKNRLKEKDITCKKLLKDELIKRAWKKQLFSRLNTVMGQFIGWIQKLEWSEKYLRNKFKEEIYNEKQKQFCEIGLFIYKKYCEELYKEEKIDFNILISKSTQKIKNEEFDVSKFKYILIDEFQDFSQLFQNLINAIREKNSKVNLFCVGDDWQLINGFAGSDEKFFRKFKEIANTKIISTCYRSTPEIIKNGNKFAQKYNKTFIGDTSKPFRSGTGNIETIKIDDDKQIRVINDRKKVKENGYCLLEDNEFKKYFRKEKKEDDEEFLSNSDYIKARYLKKCFEIVKKNSNKSFLFLSRNKNLKGLDLYDFFNKDLQKENAFLAKVLKEKNIGFPNIKFQTMHSSKGLEADVVILLNICNKVNPSIHPFNELFEIFGRTPDKILDEEKRLFYVAITRAKEKLFILTQEGKESEFII